MQFKVDENLPAEIASLLRQAGHGAATVVEEQLTGSKDPDLASAAPAVPTKFEHAVHGTTMRVESIHPWTRPAFVSVCLVSGPECLPPA